MPLLRAVADGRSDCDGWRLDDEQVDFALALGLGPLLFHVAKDDPHALEQHNRLRAAGSDLAGRAVHGRLVDALCEVLDAARDAAGPIALLKGISICRHYPQRHHRQMGDVDLLVPPGSLGAVERILADLGYRPGDFGMAPGFYEDHHHVCPFVHRDTGVRIETHRALFPPHCGVAEDGPLGLANVRAQLVDATFEGRDVQRFGPEMALAYTAAHWAYDMHLPMVFFGLIDVIMLLRAEADTIDWDLVGSWTGEREVVTPLWVMLGYLRENDLVELDPGVVRRIAGGPKAVGRAGRRALFRTVDRSLTGTFGEGIGSKEVREIVWQTLLFPTPALANLYSVPRNVLFPPRHEERFSLRFQLRRAKSLMGLNR